MKNILYILLFFSVLVQGQNHVKTTTYKVPTTTSISSPTIEQAIVEKVFTDGLERPLQHIAHKQSVSGNDVITHIYYDDHGRQSRGYLPYVSSGSTMNFNENAKSESETYYNQPEYQNTLNPYSEQFYEPSPLSRVQKQGAPGNDWNGNDSNGKTIHFEYKFNGENEVKLFQVTTSVNANSVYEATLVNSSGNVFYDKNQLYKNVVKDENWTSGNAHTTVEFTDKSGKVVLKRTYVTNQEELHSNFGNLETSDTYYVYDKYGNLSFVIPPKAVDKGMITEQVLNDLCYRYHYDRYNRLVEKKQPGRDADNGWECIVYDKFDRVVATGPVYSPFTDSNALGWNVIKYDVFGRVAFTGWTTQQATTRTGRKNFQLQVDSRANHHVTRLNSTIDGISTGYSNNSTYPASFKLLTVNYYDKYDYPQAVNPPSDVEGQSVTANLKGLATGSWVRVLTTASETLAEKTQLFYDQKARVIRTRKQNHLGGYTQTDAKLVDFSGVTQYVTTTHKRVNGDTELKIREDFEYTPHGRLLKHTHEINNSGNLEVLTHNTYNELGQLTTKKTGRTENNPLQTVDYKYNIRGWLTNINDVDNLGTDLFAFRISYNEVQNTLDGQIQPQYNGNIAETFWRTSNDNVLRSYGYKYDQTNRMRAALYQKPLVNNLQPMNSYNEEVSYDKNGNILRLSRTGDLDLDDSFSIEIDKLTYRYDDGNKLYGVHDASNHPQGFNDRVRAQNTNEFEYDDFGNMITDAHKGITGIDYNHLNLPKEMRFSGTVTKKITYLYNALGQKLSKEVTNGINVTSTEYQGGFQYKNEVLKFFATSEGYVNNTVSNGNNLYSYVYNYKDHLGNIRVSYSVNPSNNQLRILEQNHYYPFGLKHTKYGVDTYFFNIRGGYNTGGSSDLTIGGATRLDMPYQYKYNHQEWQDEFDLNVYAMDMRQYDPAIARWVVMDPVIHFDFSPYNAFDNNPVFWADPSGGNSISLHNYNVDHYGRNKFDNMGLFIPFGDRGEMDFTYMSRLFSAENAINNLISEMNGGGSGGTNGAYLINLSSYTIYFKPEGKMIVDGIEYENGGAYALASGGVWFNKIDGIAAPHLKKGQVFKVTNGIKAVVTDGGITWSGAIHHELIMKSFGGWRNEQWLSEISADSINIHYRNHLGGVSNYSYSRASDKSWTNLFGVSGLESFMDFKRYHTHHRFIYQY